MADNIAVLDGFTEDAIATSTHGIDLYLLVKPGTDFSDTFKAWDTDAQEWIKVSGWLFTVHVLKSLQARCVTEEELAEERAALSAEDRAVLDRLPLEMVEDLGITLEIKDQD